MNTAATKHAIWVGGPPGKTMIRISKQLREQADIEVVSQVGEGKNIPNRIPMSGIDLVLINTDMIQHNLQEKARQAADDAGVPWCFAKLSTVLTLKNLELKGIIEPPANEDEDDEVIDSDASEPLKPTGAGWFLSQDDGALHIRMPRGAGGKRRVKPLQIGKRLFLSGRDAAEALGVHPSTISDALSAGEFQGQAVGLPLLNDIVLAYPEIEVDPELLDDTGMARPQALKPSSGTEQVVYMPPPAPAIRPSSPLAAPKTPAPNHEPRPQSPAPETKTMNKTKLLTRIKTLLSDTTKPEAVRIEASIVLLDMIMEDDNG